MSHKIAIVASEFIVAKTLAVPSIATFIVNSSKVIKYRHVGAITNKTLKKIDSLINEIE